RGVRRERRALLYKKKFCVLCVLCGCFPAPDVNTAEMDRRLRAYRSRVHPPSAQPRLAVRGGLSVKRLCVVIVGLIACCLAQRAAAQDTTGTIAGRIVDAQNLAVPGVTVTATGSQGVKTAVTDGDGRFTVPFLTPGSYVVHAELQGFQPVDRSDLQ